MEAAFKDELQGLADGFTEKELDEDRNGWLQARQTQRVRGPEPCRTLLVREQDDRTMVCMMLDNSARNLRSGDVNAAMHAVIDPTKVSIVKAGDFKKADAAAAQ